MVNAYETVGVAAPLGHPADMDMDELRQAVEAGDYRVPAHEIARAVLSWHQGLNEGRVPHEVAPPAGEQNIPPLPV